jgi:hypothetical protein
MKLDLFEHNRTWSVGDCYITGTQLKAFLEAVPDEAVMKATVGALNRSDRRFDTAVRILKLQGLIRFNKNRRAWERIPTAVLSDGPT